MTDVAVLYVLKAKLQKKYISNFLSITKNAINSLSVRNIANVNFPVPGLP